MISKPIPSWKSYRHRCTAYARIFPSRLLGLVRGLGRGNCHPDGFSGTRKSRRLSPKFLGWAMLPLMTSSRMANRQKVIDNHLPCSFAISSNAPTRFYCHGQRQWQRQHQQPWHSRNRSRKTLLKGSSSLRFTSSSQSDQTPPHRRRVSHHAREPIPTTSLHSNPRHGNGSLYKPAHGDSSWASACTSTI